jgi:AraC-like DNA-binding protein
LKEQLGLTFKQWQEITKELDNHKLLQKKTDNHMYMSLLYDSKLEFDRLRDRLKLFFIALDEWIVDFQALFDKPLNPLSISEISSNSGFREVCHIVRAFQDLDGDEIDQWPISWDAVVALGISRNTSDERISFDYSSAKTTSRKSFTSLLSDKFINFDTSVNTLFSDLDKLQSNLGNLGIFGNQVEQHYVKLADSLHQIQHQILRPPHHGIPKNPMAWLLQIICKMMVHVLNRMLYQEIIPNYYLI